MSKDLIRSRFALRDAISQSFDSLRGRGARSALTAMGTIVGIAAFVTTSGYASTARAQVSDRFDALRATEVFVRTIASPPAYDGTFPTDFDEQLERLQGVEAAGVLGVVSDPQLQPGLAPNPGAATGDMAIQLIAATPGGVRALQPIVRGHLFNAFHEQRGERVAVVGRAVADQLRLNRLVDAPVIFLGTDAYVVIGIIDDVARRADVLNSVVIPERTLLDRYPSEGQQQEGVIEVAPGAAATIGRQVAVAIDPFHPERYQAQVPPDPRTLRMSVEGDVQKLFLGLALIALAMGVIAITNATLVAVMERTGEIGLRRALGARRVHIAGQVVIESAIVGGVGGLIGTSLGVLAVSVIAIEQQWSAVISPAIVLVAPMVGIACGVAAGLYPALRASRVEPVEALRSA